MKKVLTGAIVVAIMSLSIATCKRETGPSQAQQEKFAMVKASGGLNMRSAPTVSAEKLMSLPAGTRVKIVSLSDKKEKIGKTEDFWAQVEFEGKRGWVFNGFLIHDNAQTSEGAATMKMDVRSLSMKNYLEGLAKKSMLQVDMGEFAFFVSEATDGSISYRCNVVCGEGCENPPTCEISSMSFEEDRLVLHIIENKSVKKKCVAAKGVFTDPAGSIPCEVER